MRYLVTGTVTLRYQVELEAEDIDDAKSQARDTPLFQWTAVDDPIDINFIDNVTSAKFIEEDE